MNDPSCFICDKHAAGNRAQGGVLVEDDLVYVGHLHTMGEATTCRGWPVVETRRHVSGLGDLSDDEARAVGSMVNRVAGVLRRNVGAEHVYSFVLGDAVPHLHVHVVPRYPNTPREYWAARLAEWPEAPQVGEAEMRALVSELRRGLAPSE